MNLDTFNRADDEAARALLLTCAAVPRWAAQVAAGRPYPDVAAALAAARSAAWPWTEEEVTAALARHPRIGERPPGASPEEGHSRREQAGVDLADDDVARRLREGNRAYEERFGQVFLIRAAGRSAPEILAALDERLAHDPGTEREVVARELREIAVLRLQGELA